MLQGCVYIKGTYMSVLLVSKFSLCVLCVDMVIMIIVKQGRTARKLRRTCPIHVMPWVSAELFSRRGNCLHKKQFTH